MDTERTHGMKARFGRYDLDRFEPNKVDVPHKEAMMCLNESPFNPFFALGNQIFSDLSKLHVNRYFSDITDELLDLLSVYAGVSREQILMGNGADEMLYYFFIANREEREDALLYPAPSYFDYFTYSRAVGMRGVSVDLHGDFSLNEDEFIDLMSRDDIKCAVICNPNNPTGNLIDRDSIENVLKSTDKPVLVDEAYYEFSRISTVDLLDKYDNLFVLRSFSKGFFAAGLRFGYILSSKENIHELKKVFTAFNLSLVVQTIAKTMLENTDCFSEKISQLIQMRQKLIEKMTAIKELEVFASHTNFITFKCGGRKEELHNFLGEKQIAVRDVSSHRLLRDCLRVSIGLKNENQAFIEALEEFYLA